MSVRARAAALLVLAAASARTRSVASHLGGLPRTDRGPRSVERLDDLREPAERESVAFKGGVAVSRTTARSPASCRSSVRRILTPEFEGLMRLARLRAPRPPRHGWS